MARVHKPTRAELAATCEDLLTRMERIDNLLVALQGQAHLAAQAASWRASQANWHVLQAQVQLLAKTAADITSAIVPKHHVSSILPKR